MAGQFPGIGRFVAEFWLPADSEVERTLKTAGHFTVWADPEVLLARVASVVRVA
jgi:hypothetical protein